MKLIPRAEAKSLGLDYYCTGRPCLNGNVYFRALSDCKCACKDCLSERAIKKRKERAENADKISKQRRARRIRNIEKIRAQERSSHHRYKEKNNAVSSARYYANREESLKLRRAHYEKNYEGKKHEYAERTAHRRLRTKRQTPPWFSEIDSLIMAEAHDLASIRK